VPDPSLTRRTLSLMTLALAGCNSYLPQDGPMYKDVIAGASLRIGTVGPNARLAYALVKVDGEMLRRLRSEDDVPTFDTGLIAASNNGGANGIGTGDLVGVTIFEAGAGGLFVPAEPGSRAGNYVQLPPQQVDGSGNILVPFAGQVRAAGRSPQAVARDIQAKLADRALEPQAVVTITERRSNAVNVTGDVTSSAHFSLEPGGERILGAVSRAGGPKFPAYESLVTLQRGSTTAKAFLSEILRNPEQNIRLQAGDTVYVSRMPRYYLALGAVGPGQYLGLVNRRLPFEDSRLSLAAAIAKVGGLSDDRANARAAFVYRFEQRAALTSIGVQTQPDTPSVIPTVYYVDLSDPAGYFHANQFSMRDEDLIYVSNSPSTDLAKFLALILPLAYSTANFRSL